MSKDLDQLSGNLDNFEVCSHNGDVPRESDKMVYFSQ